MLTEYKESRRQSKCGRLPSQSTVNIFLSDFIIFGCILTFLQTFLHLVCMKLSNLHFLFLVSLFRNVYPKHSQHSDVCFDWKRRVNEMYVFFIILVIDRMGCKYTQEE